MSPASSKNPNPEKIKKREGVFNITYLSSRYCFITTKAISNIKTEMAAGTAHFFHPEDAGLVVPRLVLAFDGVGETEVG